jgi:AraC-like DNA-binding protein
VVDPGDVFEAPGRFASLRQRMQDAPDLGGALDALERFLLERLHGARELHAAASAASERLLRTAGRERVAALARETGLSERRLHELFRLQVGVAPKRYARILRFRHALVRLSGEPEDELADVAQDCGYFDQAHLCRDFRDLAQLTPQQYRGLADPDGDGPDVIPG